MYHIKYSIIKINIEFTRQSKLNINKQSSIRGIIGNALIKENCIIDKNNRVCERCLLQDKCIAHNIFSPKVKLESNEIIEEQVSPFIIICDDKREKIEKNEILSYAMVFFGDTIAYIPTIIRAIIVAGNTIGLEKNNFNLISVLNDEGDEIFKDNIFSLDKVNIRTIKEYIENRLSISEEVSEIRIINPIRFKKNKRFHDDLSEEEIVNLIKRRLVTLAMLEGRSISIEQNFKFRIIDKNLRWREFKRYSNRQKSKMTLGGVSGYIKIDNIEEDTKKLLIAGELVHIGKSTSFGLGDYILY